MERSKEQRMGIYKQVVNNKKAFHDYFIEERFEVGLVLTGTEVKSVRGGRAAIKEAHCEIKQGEAFVVGMHISPYEMGNRYNVDPIRRRKLLMHRREINKLIGYTKQQGYTLVPINLYITDKGLVKMEIGVAKGKKNYDKRDSIAKRDADRRIQQEVRGRG